MKRIRFQWRCAQPNDQQINHGTRGAEPPSAPWRGRKITVEVRGLLDQGCTEGGNIWHPKLGKRSMATYCGKIREKFLVSQTA